METLAPRGDRSCSRAGRRGRYRRLRQGKGDAASRRTAIVTVKAKNQPVGWGIEEKSRPGDNGKEGTFDFGDKGAARRELRLFAFEGAPVSKQKGRPWLSKGVRKGGDAD